MGSEMRDASSEKSGLIFSKYYVLWLTIIENVVNIDNYPLIYS